MSSKIVDSESDFFATMVVDAVQVGPHAKFHTAATPLSILSLHLQMHVLTEILTSTGSSHKAHNVMAPCLFECAGCRVKAHVCVRESHR